LPFRHAMLLWVTHSHLAERRDYSMNENIPSMKMLKFCGSMNTDTKVQCHDYTKLCKEL